MQSIAAFCVLRTDPPLWSIDYSPPWFSATAPVAPFISQPFADHHGPLGAELKKKSTGMEAGAVADRLAMARSTLRGHFVSAGMGAFIYVLNALGGQVRIYLCGAEALVPQ